MTESARTPMLLIAGSLGSGKTTLLLRLLAAGPERVAVLVNEFGELGLDGEIIAGDDVDMMELAGGCVCCSLAGEFRSAVREIIDRFEPRQIAVETTGVAEADALVMDVEEELPEVRLDAVVVLVDADAASRFARFGYAEYSQLESADFIVLNKIDLVDDNTVNDLRDRLAVINSGARLLETRQAAVDPRLLLEAPPRATPRSPTGAAPQRESGHGIESFHWQPPGDLDRACFERALAEWPETVFRAKGRLRLDGQAYWFHWVAGRWSLEQAHEGAAGLVWIGPGLERWRAAIIGGLEVCLV